MVVHPKEARASSSAFHENDIGSKEKTRFLGVIKKRYVGSLVGALHAIASIISMLLGNVLFVSQVVVGFHFSQNVKLAFFTASALSATIVATFFWNNVQSWMLSTTSVEEKGLTPKNVQDFNRARGAIAPLNASLFPLLVHLSPEEWLEKASFSVIYAIVSLLWSAKTFQLVRAYQTKLFTLYGLFHALLACSVLSYGNIAAMLQAYPKLLNHAEQQAYFLIACVQFGFLLYYFYSRRMVSKQFVRNACLTYHPTMVIVYASQILTMRWWEMVPTPVVLHSSLMVIIGVMNMSQMIKKLVL
jgi:hypothetical protein